MTNMEKSNPFEKEPSSESLEDFQQEINNLIDKEIEEKKEKANRDLLDIEVGKLIQEDMKAWQNYKKLTEDNITKKDLEDSREYSDLDEVKKEPSRRSFAAFLNNRLYVLWGKKELKEIKK